MTAWPAVQALATEVVGFYGDRFCYREDTSAARSNFNLDIIPEPLSLREATLRLALTGDREPQGLAHELLHLQQPARGRPVGYCYSTPDDLDIDGGRFREGLNKVGNLVGHQIMIREFTQFGFDKESFLSPPDLLPDYRAIGYQTTPSHGRNPDMEYSWWCLEYFRHWITHHQIGGFTGLGHAHLAIECGSRVHRGLRLSAAKMREWVLDGGYSDLDAYPRELNRLLHLMRFPTYTRWARFRRGGTGEVRVFDVPPSGFSSLRR